ncbi:DNA helicase UvrD, partial [Pseudomonas syringae pv. tagetis]
NLGLVVPSAVAGMSFASDDPDRLFFEGLSLFWKAFETHLLAQSPPIMTYNRMYALLGETSHDNLKHDSDHMLRPLAQLI